MALNFSHRSIFPTHLSDDNMVTPMRIANGYLVEGIPEENGDGFNNWHLDCEMEDCFDYETDRDCTRCVSQDSVSKDILDLLPTDPFGMDISTTFTAAITGLLGDLEVDYGGYRSDEAGTSDGNCQLLAELNFLLNNAMRFQSFTGNTGFEHNLHVVTGSSGCFLGNEVVGETSSHGGLESACNMDEILSYGNVGYGICHDKERGAPHPALSFALGFLGVRDLLIIEGVCRSLCSTVRSDPLLWRSIHIDQPLSEKITDDALLQLTNRAQGNLQCLSLVECLKITDDGLKRVLENNPRLTKLSVPGCTRLSIEGIINSLKAFKSISTTGIKHLRIGGLYGVTPEHFEELKLLLGPDYSMQPHARKPHFYHRGKFYLPCEDERVIDIEVCPRCQNLRLVYDCPAEGCQGQENISQLCRACTLCIARCAQCGRCINDSEYEETFCLEFLCSDCGKQLLTSQERQVRRIELNKAPDFDEPCSGLCHHG